MTTVTGKTIEDVREFWESNPLFSGEATAPAGSRAFFEEHRSVYVADCFAGRMDPRIFPGTAGGERVLDLGCGPGFWTIELLERGAEHVTAADLTKNALALTRRRAELYGLEVETSRQNAERLTFPSGRFSHVNCQGVIHHTPDTEACVREIARVLRPGGTALISVYHRNVFLRAWPLLRFAGRFVAKLGGGMKGRGRESIYAIDDVDEIVRRYDGVGNPVGKAYSRRQLVHLLSGDLEVEKVFLHFFPARSLPVRLPRWLHRRLDAGAGFMIYATCRKR